MRCGHSIKLSFCIDSEVTHKSFIAVVHQQLYMEQIYHAIVTASIMTYVQLELYKTINYRYNTPAHTKTYCCLATESIPRSAPQGTPFVSTAFQPKASAHQDEQGPCRYLLKLYSA